MNHVIFNIIKYSSNFQWLIILWGQLFHKIIFTKGHGIRKAQIANKTFFYHNFKSLIYYCKLSVYSVHMPFFRKLLTCIILYWFPFDKFYPLLYLILKVTQNLL